jgi:hypothetical protein
LREFGLRFEKTLQTHRSKQNKILSVSVFLVLYALSSFPMYPVKSALKYSGVKRRNQVRIERTIRVLMAWYFSRKLKPAVNVLDNMLKLIARQ